jgi:molecular chaperone GrpE
MKNKKAVEEKIEDEIVDDEAIENQEPASAEAADVSKTASAEATDVSKEDEYLLGWKRCQADFENYKKRQAESQKDLFRYSIQAIVMQILPVIDNFQASTAHIPEDQKENPWVTGIMYIQKQLEQVLADNGVEECAVKVGDNFDPAEHEAVESKECNCDENGEKKEFQNKVKQVVTRGYKMGDRIIRPARVTVE